MYRKVGNVVHTPELGYFCLLPEDVVGAAFVVKHSAYMAAEVKRAVKSMPFMGTALVVGAHLGTLALPLSQHCEELVAIEPNPRAFELLELNAAMNGCSNVTLVNAAANDKEETIPFFVQYQNSGGSSRKPVATDGVWHEQKHDEIEVQGVRLDDVFPERTFDLITMDCEGSENKAMLGMPRLLDAAHAVIVEMQPQNVTGIAGITAEQFVAPLREAGFRKLYIPTTGQWVTADNFQFAVQWMLDRQHVDDGLIFRRT